MDLASVRKTAGDFGWPATLGALATKAVNRVLYARVLKCIQITEVNPKYLAIDPKFRHGFLDEATLRRFSKDAQYQLSSTFLDEALHKGDQCYGIVDGEVLASFGWYATTPTHILPDLQLRFGSRHVYMYKGFTHPDYRGQRLHAIGMTWALKLSRERGFDGLISYVDADNFDSLRSCYRMGYQDVGAMYFARVASRYLVHTDAGCARLGVSLEKPPLSG